jgi:hypothetical protein
MVRPHNIYLKSISVLFPYLRGLPAELLQEIIFFLRYCEHISCQIIDKHQHMHLTFNSILV